jgi:hypothetical protein
MDIGIDVACLLIKDTVFIIYRQYQTIYVKTMTIT